MISLSRLKEMVEEEMENKIKDLELALKAKEQECENNKIAHQMELDIYNQECLNLSEELKETLEQLEAYKMEADEGKEINAELKAENEELKKEIAQARMAICNQCGEKDDYNIPCKQIRDLDYDLQLEIEENDKLKQTLTEIKEIAEAHKKDESVWNPYRQLDKILQKISEVEDEIINN